jgi:hypothetical protein
MRADPVADQCVLCALRALSPGVEVVASALNLRPTARTHNGAHGAEASGRQTLCDNGAPLALTNMSSPNTFHFFVWAFKTRSFVP